LSKRFPQVKRAEITVRKPNAPVPGVLDHVEVTVVYPQ
jgi:dihydroneopterin aldolase